MQQPKTKKQTFIDTLISHSTTHAFDEAILEWCIQNVSNDETIDSCICTNINTIYYLIINKFNHNQLNIGNDCLTKFLPHLKETASLLCKQFNYKKDGKLAIKRMCFACHKHTIHNAEPEWKNTCTTCFKSGVRNPQPIPILGNRMCQGCFKLIISPNEPEFKDKCIPCFKSYQANKPIEVPPPSVNGKRQCIMCQEFLIPETKPAYIKKCYDCFNGKEKKEPTEPEENLNTDNYNVLMAMIPNINI